MRFGSVCSGIEAASVAWHPLGWQAAWVAEIERFPSQVLAHHYPAVPNLGDMRTISRRVLTGEVEAPDVLVGGTPCQAFSIAGLREGLADERGQLTISYVRLFDAIDYIRRRAGKRPAISVWENVPGVLSSKDNAFGCFLAGLAGEDVELVPPGKKWANAGCVFGPTRTVAWRVLDAQYFGVAQRRKRVFVVASARKDCDPAEILFEFDGMRRDTAPSREAGQETAGTLASRTGAGGFPGTDEACSGYLQAFGGGNTGPLDTDGSTHAVCVTGDITHTLKAEGFDASEDGTGRGQPIVPAYRADSITESHVKIGITNRTEKGLDHADASQARPGEILRTLQLSIGEEAFAEWSTGIAVALQQAEILRSKVHGEGIRWEGKQKHGLVNDALPRAKDGAQWAMQCMREAGRERCAPRGWRSHEQFGRELVAYLSQLPQQGAPAARFLLDLRESAEGSWILQQALDSVEEVRRSVGIEDTAEEAMQSLRATGSCEGVVRKALHGTEEKQSTARIMAVRRLLPVECERLMGFPDGYTDIPKAADGPRYKSLGNSMCVNVMAFIGRRIQQVASAEPAARAA